ncbi:protein involved in gliding motility SprE [Pseudozobellia thermophila]|uniref:Protein involved in gliding motility SprE n=1 Tax=Pseudozobellia thermophila TaxID=192903 RepID=A0A1M6BQ42_9FLAO|nr:protein involved in gliding motility SprE [Pseudozobellia thermophila]
MISVFGGVALSACSTKKDTFVNRNWHAMNTKYNTLYNGNIAFDVGREELNNTYKDDYWEILPVERLEVTDEIKLDSEDNNPNFIIAEEKATKAIQKHSMDIRDVERNPQTDEAFLLLGKARYFDQRYIPALEAFNYIINKYDYSDKLNEARIWREKVNIRLENEELAIKNLKWLMKYEDLKDQEYADARAMMAQAYINLGVLDTAVQQLKIASAYAKKKPEKGRYYYIMGQLFNQMGHKDSANYAFEKVIALKRKSPRVYMINAELEKFRNTEITEENKEEMFEYLADLEKNRENRPFLHKIYRQIAEYHLGQKNDSLALVYFNKSLRATTDEPKLNALNYENLAVYNFDRNDYKLAGAYYDSMLTNLSENTKKYRAVKKKLDNLEDVIKYEDIVHHADSVITLYESPEAERIAYFEDYVNSLKQKEEAARKREEKRMNAGFAQFAQSKGGKENKGKFYFYNVTSLGYGKNDFAQRWGKRELADDWRWSDKSRVRQLEARPGTVAENSGGAADASEDDRMSVDYYLARIPTDAAIIDSLRAERNFANYQLGLIYKEKFKENLLAAKKLEDVLASNPEERLVLPSKYNLYKIYEEEGSPLLASMRADILKNHGDSRYAEIILNPRAVLEDDADSPEARYAALFRLYQQQEYLQTITKAEEYIDKFTGDPIVPKFEMLKANAIGRLNGFEPFEEALNYVALTYPNTPEGKKAEKMVSEQLPKLASTEFSTEEGATGTGNWKVVFPFRRSNDQIAQRVMKELEDAIKDLRYKNKVSKDIYTLEEQFVVVHGFKSKDYALGFAELIKFNKDYLIDNENFVILSSNYKIVQVHKNLQDYKNQILTPKP